jgi:hypothetical protein
LAYLLYIQKHLIQVKGRQEDSGGWGVHQKIIYLFGTQRDMRIHQEYVGNMPRDTLVDIEKRVFCGDD